MVRIKIKKANGLNAKRKIINEVMKTAGTNDLFIYNKHVGKVYSG